jgi:CRISPR/Cas system CSM-associated protein Csm3 (group 7 of RAMP superfamily)
MSSTAIKCREIVERWIVEGQLRLETPGHLGNGDSDELTDMPLLVDAVDEKRPLLTGASLAGALRAYLGEWEYGYNVCRYGAKPNPQSDTVKLFGALSDADDGDQSRLIVEDARGHTEAVERRHGVGIDRKSRTAKEQRLYDTRLWPAGSTFDIRLELLLGKNDDKSLLRRALATALTGLSDGGITLGMRKRRGFGRVCVTEWRVRCYDLLKLDDLFAWIEQDSEQPLGDQYQIHGDLAQALGVNQLLPDQRCWFAVEGEFSLDKSSLLIRTEGLDARDPDMVHLHARQPDGNLKPVLSGTSLAGALRARAYKIVNTLARPEKALELTEAMFGSEEIDDKKKATASRLHVEERVVDRAQTDLVQHRVSIDRFTGGALPTALFNQQAAIGLPETVVTLRLRLRAPENHEIGLLLLLLKDLWTSDLPLGGESSVGRGRLRGRRLELRHCTEKVTKEKVTKKWNITASGGALEISGESQQELEDFVGALQTKLQTMTARSDDKESSDE